MIKGKGLFPFFLVTVPFFWQAFNINTGAGLTVPYICLTIFLFIVFLNYHPCNFQYFRDIKPLLVFIFSFLILIANLQFIAKGWSNYLEGGADTFTSRLSQYSSYIYNIFSLDFKSFIIGVGLKEGQNISLKMSGIGSFESEFFSKYFITGTVGLIAFFYLLIGVLKIFRNSNTLLKYFGFLFVVNIIAVSLISNLVFTVYIFSFVTFFYICLINYKNRISRNIAIINEEIHIP